MTPFKAEKREEKKPSVRKKLQVSSRNSKSEVKEKVAKKAKSKEEACV